jgi:hypothetical protein
MADLFDYFNVNRILFSSKHRLKIFVMGPYSPEIAKRRVNALRDFLVSEGYCARTAEDFDDSDELTPLQIFEKCKTILLKWAHGRIFLFLKEAITDSKLIGVYDELVTATEKISEEEHYTCAVFLENGVEEKVSSMMKGRLEHFKELAVYRFSDDEQLHEMAASFCFNLLNKIYKNL